MVVRSERRDGIHWIILSRPGSLNSMSSELLHSLEDSIRMACDSESTLVAITGEGRLFSAGIDLAEVAQGTPETVTGLFEGLGNVLRAVLECRGGGYYKPVAVYLNGPAVAGGAELALAADILVAEQGAWLQWPELRWGLVPPMLLGYAVSIPGARLAALLYGMERISVEDAYMLGLVTKIVEGPGQAEEYLERIASLYETSREAFSLSLSRVRSVKRSWLSGVGDLVRLAGRPSLIEAARRFIESRKR